jgi:hypothetical protein
MSNALLLWNCAVNAAEKKVSSCCGVLFIFMPGGRGLFFINPLVVYDVINDEHFSVFWNGGEIGDKRLEYFWGVMQLRTI